MLLAPEVAEALLRLRLLPFGAMLLNALLRFCSIALMHPTFVLAALILDGRWLHPHHKC